MMRLFYGFIIVLIFNLSISVSVSAAELAYLGPGAGLSALGSILALLAAFVLAIFGFVWYPIKRLMKKKSRPNDNVDDEVEESNKNTEEASENTE